MNIARRPEFLEGTTCYSSGYGANDEELIRPTRIVEHVGWLSGRGARIDLAMSNIYEEWLVCSLI